MSAPASMRVAKRGLTAIAAGLLVASTVVASSVVTASVTAPVAGAAPSNIAGMIVFLDPGHQGSNDPAFLSKQVPTGRGGTKDCQTSGTSSNSGYTEHAFNWETTLRIRQQLTALGVRTAMSRGDDTGEGPCVDARAAMANALAPDAIVSIHADGAAATGRGFHVNYSAPPLNEVQAGPSVQFARTMRDQLVASGLTPSNYVGQGGLLPRTDIAGLNLAKFPSILVELGNMKNPADTALIESADGREKYADAVVRGIAAYLATRPQRTA